MWKAVNKIKFILTFLLFFSGTIISANEITVRYSNISNKQAHLNVVLNKNVKCISLHDFTELFNIPTAYNEITKQLQFYFNNKVIRVTAYNPFIIVNNQIYQMTIDTFLQGKDVCVPVVDFMRILSNIFPDKLSYNKNNEVITISTLDNMNINFIQIQEKTNGYLIKLSTTKNFNLSEIGLRERHGWLYVDIYGGKVDSVGLTNTTTVKGIITKVIPHQVSEQTAQLGFKLREQLLEKQIFLDNANEILISLKTKKNISEQITRELEKHKKKWLIDKIVIDPGHGGKDPGAVGRNSYEKTIVLAIAFELKRIIEKKTNIKVLMTRDDDRFVELKKRTEFANRNEAKLFISIHANSNLSHRLKGVSTYFLGQGNTDEAREVALLENSVIKYEQNNKYTDLSSTNFILSAMAQNVYNTESEDLAAIVQHEISRTCGVINRGVRQAGFYVLWGASMPNILVETAFISNRQEEKRLNDAKFQKKVAQAIFKGIMNFKKKYEKDI